MTSSDRFEWEYLVRINVAGYVVLPVWADNKEDAKEIAYNDIIEVLPSWCDVTTESAKRADPPSMRFFLRNIERTQGDDE
jgi:hypothetical protein